MAENLLRNSGFEVDWSEEESHRCLVLPADGDAQEKDVGNVFTPANWLTWFRHEPGTWDQPEVRDVWKSHDPRRVRSGRKGVLLFTFHRKHDAGFLQQVQVQPGTRLRLTAWAHAWSNHSLEGHRDCAGDPRCSCGVGRDPAFLLEEDVPPLNGEPWNDAIGNFSFMLGIDPTGGTDPYADAVEWGPTAHIYNGYHEVLAVEATAEAETVTVFLRSKTLWAFNHNDAYWDDAELVGLGEAAPEEPPEEPSEEPLEEPAEEAPKVLSGEHTKLGAHVLRVTDDISEFIQASPAVVKLAGDWSVGGNVPEGVLVVGRKHQDYDAQGQRSQGQTPREAAERFVQDQLETYEANPYITYWEGHNEPVWSDTEGMDWYAQFEVERIRLMDERGLKCVIGNFAAGAPPLDLWPAFLPAIEAGLDREALLGLHEYGCPWMWWMTGSYQLDPDEDQGDEGWTTLRYRKVYRQHLLPNELQIPLVITECGIDPMVNPKPPEAPAATWKGLGDFWKEHHDGPVEYTGSKADYYFRQLIWYGEELRKDDYVVGATIFTWGSWEGVWKDFDISGTRVAEKLIQYTEDSPAEPFEYSNYSGAEPEEAPEAPELVPPREAYRRSYVLLPQIEDTVERLDWRTAAAIGSSKEMRTVGHSADDAGVGPAEREVIAVNPEQWDADLKAWYDEHYPGVEYKAIETESPWEMAIKLLSPLDEDIALAQTDSRWQDYDFGEHPDVGEETIGRYGCFLTGLAIILRKIYRRNVTPPVLDKLLVAARAAYVNDNIMAWGGAIPLFSIFDDNVKDNRQRSARELESLLSEGWEIILRRADGGHFVYLEDVDEDVLHIIDTWDGERKRKVAADYRGIRAAHVKQEMALFTPPSEVLVGLHDESGGEWMADQGLAGCCLVHRQVQRRPIQLDCSEIHDAGIVVIGRLNWGYADGTGTFPRPEHKDAFVHAVAETMLSAQGIDYFHVGNEPNNRQEWPGFTTDDEFELLPEYVTEIYNEIWEQVGGRVKMGPPPIDPYFGPGSNNQDWWIHILGNISGADALFLHSKTQTNDPAEIWSEEKFASDPLTWQYLHLRTVETSMEVVPERFHTLPVFITELNPQFQRISGGELGWLADNAEWIREAVRYCREEYLSRVDTGQPITGVVFYRYEVAGDQAAFGLRHKPAILDAIREEAEIEEVLATISSRREAGLLTGVWRRLAVTLAG